MENEFRKMKLSELKEFAKYVEFDLPIDGLEKEEVVKLLASKDFNETDVEKFNQRYKDGLRRILGKMKVRELKVLAEHVGLNLSGAIRKGELVKLLALSDLNETDIEKFKQSYKGGIKVNRKKINEEKLVKDYINEEKSKEYIISKVEIDDTYLLINKNSINEFIKDEKIVDYYYNTMISIGRVLEKKIIRRDLGFSIEKTQGNIEYLKFNKKEIYSLFSYVFRDISTTGMDSTFNFHCTGKDYYDTKLILNNLIEEKRLTVFDCVLTKKSAKVLWNTVILIHKIDQKKNDSNQVECLHEKLWDLSNGFIRDKATELCPQVYSSLLLLLGFEYEFLSHKENEEKREEAKSILSDFSSMSNHSWIRVVIRYFNGIRYKYDSLDITNQKLKFEEICKVKIFNAPYLEKVYGYPNGYKVFNNKYLLEEYTNYLGNFNVLKYVFQEEINHNQNSWLKIPESLDVILDVKEEKQILTAEKREFKNKLSKIQEDILNTKAEILTIDETIKNLRKNISDTIKPLDEKLYNVTSEVKEHLKQQKSSFLEQLDTKISEVTMDIDIITKRVTSLENNYVEDKAFYQGAINNFSERLNDIDENYRKEDDKVKKAILQQIMPELNRILPLADEHLATEYKQESIMVVDEKDFKTKNYEQKIFSGVPGCGKSYAVNKIIEGSENYRVTFFPEYENHNFVGTIKPKVKNGIPIYEFVAGPFTKALKYAYHHPEEKVNLVIEEMTRGNASAIFGEVFQLLDRDENGWSEYPVENENIFNEIGVEVNGKLTLNSISLPPNFAIYGTLNTSDQNVFALDSAFKRRFKDEYISIKDVTVERDFKLMYCNKTIKWSEFYKTINEYIIDNIGMSEDKQVGPYRIKKADDIDSVLRYLYTDIDCISYSGKRLFNDTVKSQEGLGVKFATKKIFNEELNKKLVGEQ